MKNRKHDIEKYLRGELSASEMHALEKEALDDPFLAEALEGVEHAGGADNFLYDLHELNRSVHQRSHKRKPKTLQVWEWAAAAAATLLLVVVSGFMVINLLREQRREQQAQRAEERLLLEMSLSRDTLTLVLPPQIAYHKAGPEQRATDRRAATPQQRHGATTAQESIPDRLQGAQQQPADVAAAVDDTAVEQSENPTGAAHEPIALADTPEVAPPDEDEGEREAKISSAKAGRRAQAGKARSEIPSPSRTQAEVTHALRGKVTSSTDGDGLPGVNVLVKGTGVGTVTDHRGHYEIIVTEEEPTLVFSFVGFQPSEVKATGNGEVNVSLEEDAASLSEVVVTGFASEGIPNVSGPYRSAEPSLEKGTFKDYLTNAIRYPAEAIRNKTEGRVTIRFTVEPDGQLTNFEVLKGIGSGCDEELIRAVREGPAWKPARRGEEPLREEVKVRYVFRLP